MAVNRVEIIDSNFTAAVHAMAGRPSAADLQQPIRPASSLSAEHALRIFESMVASRQLDIAARELKGRGEGFYTIQSAGHECDAAVAAASRPTDMAFLHYRSGGFFVHRASQVPGSTPLFDVLLGMVASSDDPISGGRHKVFGSVPLNIPPQTSTIASHLPKAVGAAFTLARIKRLGLEPPIPKDSVILCSFGDASSNHSTACGAFNTAALADYQNLPCPILFICEDNGLGISVRTPTGSIQRRFQGDPGLKYFGTDGLDISATYDVAKEAIEYVRQTRRPTFLHLKLVRLLGHAGSDVEQAYRTEAEIEANEAQDPLINTAQLLVDSGTLQPEQVLTIYEETRQRVSALADEAVKRPKITTRSQVMASLARHDEAMVNAEATRALDPETRQAFFDKPPEDDRPRHMAVQINRVLGEALLKYPESLIFGEDVARKGGVYHVTADLQKRLGVGRVFNTPLDETAILGLAIGAGHMGMLPIPEIQYLAYLFNAIDQLRGEAASMQFFSDQQYQNPMVVRIASLAYQKGFGGHFHNDNALAGLREIPGLVIACPSNGRDAVGMMRTCLAAAKVNGRVCAFMEPIALYMTKDLHEPRDGAWSCTYPSPAFAVPVGQADIRGDGEDLTIVTYGNGVWMSLRVAERLRADGIGCRIVDLRWLNPLPSEQVFAEAQATGRVLFVDECRRSSGVAEALLAELADRQFDGQTARVTGADSFIPLGAAANLVLVSEEEIEEAARMLVDQA